MARIVVPDRRIQEEHSRAPADNLRVIGPQAFFMRLGQNVGDRHTRWSTFLKAHWECLTATDFLSVEVYTIKGLVTYYVLFFIDIASRSVHIAGITPHPDNRWMTQMARNVTDVDEGFLRGTRYLILDRDTKYTDEFRSVLDRQGIHLIRLPR